MEKFKNLLNNKKLVWTVAAIAVLLVTGILLAVLLPGAAENPNPSTTGAGKQSYTLQLQTEGGMALGGVDVYLYGDEALSDLVAVCKTGTDGSASFEADAAKLYAVPKGIPAGYVLESSYPITQASTQLQFKTQLLTTMGPVAQGGIMFDFTVTATDGTQYTLSELLKTKKAVVLNFWFANCGPCQAEFPYLQEAYDQYSEDVAVLALSPVDDPATVAQYQAAMGLTIPMASVDQSLADPFGLAFYPTTVIIDRYGMVSLKHIGAATDTATFADAFAFYASEDYKQQLVSDIADLKAEEAPEGSKEKPFEFGGVTEFEVEIDAGATVYCHVYRVSGMQLTIQDADVSAVYNEQTYKSENGAISFVVTAPDTFTPVELALTNESTAKKTVKVKFSFLPGTMDNPHNLQLGAFTAEIAAGNSQGEYYSYTAEKEGILSVVCQGATEGVSYGYTLYNLNSYAYRTLDSDGVDGLLTISVKAGDVVQFIAATLPDEENQYPAAQLQFVASFEEQTLPTDPQPTVPSTAAPQPTTPATTPTQPTVPSVTEPQPTVPATTTKPTTPPVTTQPTVPSTAPTEPTTKPTTVPPTTAAPTVPATTAPQQAAYTDLYVGKAYHVTVGVNDVTLAPDEDGVTYFLFVPSESGTYELTASAQLRYFGSNTSYIWDQTDNLDVVNNTFSLNVKESNLGAAYILGVKASAGSATLTIQRTGDAVLGWEDLPYDVYNGVYTPKPYTFPGGTLTYVNITDKPENYKLLLGSDGYYHLNSEDGPLVYLNLGSAANNPAKETDTTLYGMLHSNRPIIQGTVKDENGNNLYKRQYNDLVQKYIDCADSGLYPLTPDLMEILKTQNDSWYIWLVNLPGHSRVKKEMSWMANLCYVQ